MKNDENRISFIKDVKITDGKADTIYSAQSNEIEKCCAVERELQIWKRWGQM